MKPVIHNENLHYCYDHWVDAAGVTISAFDLTVIRGYGVFDFVRTHDRNFVWLDDHLDRLYASAAAMHLKLGRSRGAIKQLLEDALEHNPSADIGVRIILSGGISEDSLSIGHDSSLILLVHYCRLTDPKLYSDGIAFVTFNSPRQLPVIKSTNYTASLNAAFSLTSATPKNILLIDDSNDPLIYEGAVSNVFFVKDSIVVTSPAKSVLNGIMRGKVIAALRQDGYKVEQRFLKMSELSQVSEAFVTNSNLKVVPISSIDSTRLALVPGPVARNALQMMTAAIEQAAAY